MSRSKKDAIQNEMKPIHIKPSNKGLLRKELGAKKGEKIPAAKLAQAAHSKNPALKKRAIFAENFRNK